MPDINSPLGRRNFASTAPRVLNVPNMEEDALPRRADHFKGLVVVLVVVVVVIATSLKMSLFSPPTAVTFFFWL